MTEDFTTKYQKMRERVGGKVVNLPKSQKSTKRSTNDNATLPTLDEDPDLTALNKEYAVVRIGGKTRIVFFEESPIWPGCKSPVFSSVSDFKEFLRNRKKQLPRSDGESSWVEMGKWWLSQSHRRQYDGVVYAPTADDCTRLNLWTGFSVMPQAGDCSLFKSHLKDNICAGSAEHAAYLWAWMARSVQQPGSAGEVAIVQRGKEGTGKGVFAREFGRLFGSHFRHVVHAGHLVGHFNAHLQHCSLLYADEAFFAGDRGHESTLKALITEETLLIEPKGLDPFPVRNCLHVIMSSNSDWVVPAGADARRYFVLDVSDAQMQNAEYFDAVVKQMGAGGREALLHELLREDLSGFNVRAVPQTAALAEQKAFSRRGVDLLIEVIASSGVLPNADPAHPNVAITSGESEGRGFYRAARTLAPDLKHRGSIVIARELTKVWRCAPWKDRSRRGIEFPPLGDLRALFDERHGEQDWPDMDEWASSPPAEDEINAGE
jgi:hypothetical protein